MRLVAVEFDGFRRFAQAAKLECDGPLTAVVGPNEAGKTSILEALLRLDDRDPIEPGDLTRRTTPPATHDVVSALYLVEPEDQAAIAHLHSANEPQRARWLIVQKRVNGTVVTELKSPLVRDLRPREKAVRQISRIAKRLRREKLEEGSPLANPSLESLTAELRGDRQTLAEETLDALRNVNAALDEFAGLPGARETQSALAELVEGEDEEHPTTTARKILYRRVPDFLLFGERERELQSDYDLQQAAGNPPPALDNLRRLAGLDLRELHSLIVNDESGEVVERLERAMLV